MTTMRWRWFKRMRLANTTDSYSQSPKRHVSNHSKCFRERFHLWTTNSNESIVWITSILDHRSIMDKIQRWKTTKNRRQKFNDSEQKGSTIKFMVRNCICYNKIIIFIEAKTRAIQFNWGYQSIFKHYIR